MIRYGYWLYWCLLMFQPIRSAPRESSAFQRHRGGSGRLTSAAQMRALYDAWQVSALETKTGPKSQLEESKRSRSSASPTRLLLSHTTNSSCPEEPQG